MYCHRPHPWVKVVSGLQESLFRVVMGVPPAVDTAFAYKFNVLVGYQSGAQLVGTVSVLPNYPPVGGSISVSPKNGVAMTDDFLVSAVGHYLDRDAKQRRRLALRPKPSWRVLEGQLPDVSVDHSLA